MQKDSRILITGGTGFVGSHLVELLISEGFSNVLVTTRKKDENLTSVRQCEVDLTQKEGVIQCFQEYKPEFIINLAAIASVGDSFQQPEKLIAANASMMVSVLEAFRQVTPTAKFLHISSAAVYGVSENEDEIPQRETHPLRPVNPYAVSKLTQEFLAQSYARSYNLAIVYARPFNHIGERQTVSFAVPAFINQIIDVEAGTKNEVSVGNLDAIRDFSDVKDVVRSYVVLLEKGKSGEIYNIGTGTGKSMREVLDFLMQQSAVPIQVHSAETLLRPLDIPVSIADNEKIKALGWQPHIPIEDTLQRIITWQRKQRKSI